MPGDDPCPDHPLAPVIAGLCGACTIRDRVGSFNIELVEPTHVTGCRGTVHCANFGFCHRCHPDLARAGSLVVQAMGEIGRGQDGRLYGKLMRLLRLAAPPAGAAPGTGEDDRVG